MRPNFVEDVTALVALVSHEQNEITYVGADDEWRFNASSAAAESATVKCPSNLKVNGTPRHNGRWIKRSLGGGGGGSGTVTVNGVPTADAIAKFTAAEEIGNSGLVDVGTEVHSAVPFRPTDAEAGVIDLGTAAHPWNLLHANGAKLADAPVDPDDATNKEYVDAHTTINVPLIVTGPAAATLDDADRLVFFDAAADNITASLPDAADVAGIEFILRRVDSSIKTVTLTPVAGDIEGGASLLMDLNEGIILVSDGTDYWITAHYAEDAGGDIRSDGAVDFTEDQSMGGNQLTGLPTPVDDDHAANKEYVDDNIGGVGNKGARVYAAAIQAGIPNGTSAKVNFASVEFDFGSYVNDTDDPFVIPAHSGTHYYRIAAQIMLAADAGTPTGPISLQIIANGSLSGRVLAICAVRNIADAYVTLFVEAEYPLAAGDTINFKLNNSTGQAVSVSNAAGGTFGSTWASIRLVAKEA